MPKAKADKTVTMEALRRFRFSLPPDNSIIWVDKGQAFAAPAHLTAFFERTGRAKKAETTPPKGT